MSRPIIGLTPDEATPPTPFAVPRYELKRAYADAVLAAGGLPLVLPYSDDPEVLAQLIAMIDGLVVTGGAFDVPPALYGEAPREGLGALKPGRTTFELALIRAALDQRLPLLGVCGGMQILNVALGGSLYQDIGADVPGALAHEQKTDRQTPAHPVLVRPGSLLARACGEGTLAVNSTHHQSVRRLGAGLIASASSSDGLAEAIELPAAAFVLGVQWHPELLVQSVPAHLGIYRSLVAAARVE
jgi:putative glutamine amidotransferase